MKKTLSPCIQKCELNQSKSQCIACKRYVQEITQWRELTEKEKLNIMNELARRKVVTP